MCIMFKIVYIPPSNYANIYYERHDRRKKALLPFDRRRRRFDDFKVIFFFKLFNLFYYIKL